MRPSIQNMRKLLNRRTMTLFAVCLLLERTSAGRITQFLLTAALTLVAIPVLYPICRAIDRLGGEV